MTGVTQEVADRREGVKNEKFNICIITSAHERRMTDRLRSMIHAFNHRYEPDDVWLHICGYGEPLHGMRFDLVIVDCAPGRADRDGYYWLREIVEYRMKERGVILELFERRH